MKYDSACCWRQTDSHMMDSPTNICICPELAVTNRSYPPNLMIRKAESKCDRKDQWMGEYQMVSREVKWHFQAFSCLSREYLSP